MSSQILLSRSIRLAPNANSTSASYITTSTESIDILNHGTFHFSSPDLEHLEDSTSISPSNPVTLPSEIINSIYSYLHPKDFDAARRTCRAWMTASLDKIMLLTMLARGGYSNAPTDVETWQLSCQVARHCALSAGWRGNGVEPRSNPLILTAKVDFSDLAAGYPGAGGRSIGGLLFTVSVCGRFLLAAEGGLIYVYELIGNSIRPLTSVICPRRVLAMSMDASSRRLAVAALLDGRMGLVCDLQIGRDRVSTRLERKNIKVVDSTAGGSGDIRSITFAPEPRPLWDLRSFSEESTTVREINVAVNPSAQLPECGLSSTIRRKYDSEEAVPLETGPRSLYRSLCSDDDPPRSVAICPQRQCVAFGCSAGLELHWVDALTGQDLNRWFPLTGPSDYLYFLPRRLGLDSPRKLRLISSAAHPSQRPALSQRFFAPKPVPFSLWSAIGVDARISSSASFVSDCDHYRAVPMSDGFHILFTDSESGMLCLGTDAPLGGPRKLSKKIMFKPPTQCGNPRIYTANTDLMDGPKIVAAYEDTLVLFSVPIDVFQFSRRAQQSKGILSADSEQWLRWWPEEDFPFASSQQSDAMSVWPLLVNGTIIGRLEGLVDIAVNETAGLAIWALSLDGRAAVWQIDDGKPAHTVKLRSIAKDGRVVNVSGVDLDGDIIMMDADPLEWSIIGPGTVL